MTLKVTAWEEFKDVWESGQTSEEWMTESGQTQPWCHRDRDRQENNEGRNHKPSFVEECVGSE